jgi:hypothetical protein
MITGSKPYNPAGVGRKSNPIRRPGVVRAPFFPSPLPSPLGREFPELNARALTSRTPSPARRVPSPPWRGRGPGRGGRLFRLGSRGGRILAGRSAKQKSSELPRRADGGFLPLNLNLPVNCRRFPLSPSKGERAGERGPCRRWGSEAQSASNGRGILSPRARVRGNAPYASLTCRTIAKIVKLHKSPAPGRASGFPRWR